MYGTRYKITKPGPLLLVWRPLDRGLVVNEGGVSIQLGGLEVSEDGATISTSSSTGADALAVSASSKYADYDLLNSPLSGHTVLLLR